MQGGWGVDLVPGVVSPPIDIHLSPTMRVERALHCEPKLQAIISIASEYFITLFDVSGGLELDKPRLEDLYKVLFTNGWQQQKESL